MYTFVVLLILVVECQASYFKFGFENVSIPTCNGTNMTEEHRRSALEAHNLFRYLLQDNKTSYPFRDSFPTSDNMSLLTYNCDLEKSAYNIAKLCINESQPDFNYTGSNNYSSYKGGNFVDAMYEWYGTIENLVNNTPLVNVTPSENHTALIPALQLFNGPMTELGCAFYTCNSSLTSFVCRYGDPPVKVGAQLYSPGPPCGSCNHSCVAGVLCNNSIV